MVPVEPRSSTRIGATLPPWSPGRKPAFAGRAVRAHIGAITEQSIVEPVNYSDLEAIAKTL